MTEKYHENDPMSDVISDDYRMLQMISRFGITLGFGDQTVAETCRKAGVEVTTFLTVVNYLKDMAHAHINEMAELISLPDFIRYLKNTHTYFVDFRLPGIRRKLIEALDCSSRNQISMLILKFYDEYAAEVANHMAYENTHIHPYVEDLLAGKLSSAVTYAELASRHLGNHASIEKSIAELKNIIIRYYPAGSNAQLMGEVLMDIYMTEEDLLTHCHMEDTLLAECVRRLEEDLQQRGTEDVCEEPASVADRTAGEDVSQREREIIVQVVKGLSNKEIADALFISVNTVMTHRRNISRKLGIHSTAGLTIYAIVNGLVSLEDTHLS